MSACPKVIMVVEDEFLIRVLTSDVLTDVGFDVIQAGHAEQAISLLKTHAEFVGVLFTDIHMPGCMDGLQLAHHATQALTLDFYSSDMRHWRFSRT
jgi:two-component system, response regulator PdtaR